MPTANRVLVLVETLTSAGNDRSVHVLDGHFACEVLYDGLIHHSAVSLALLVLSVNPIFSLLDTSWFKLPKVVVFITLVLLVFLFLPLAHKYKSLIMDARCLMPKTRLLRFTNDFLLVLLINLVKLLLHFLVICRLAVPRILLDRLQVRDHVPEPHLVLLAAVVAALPLEDVQRGEEHSKDHERAKIHREASQVARVTIAIRRPTGRVDKFNDSNIICHISSEPPEHEIRPENLVVLFRLSLLLLDVSEGFLASGSRSVAPADIVKVAHGVDLEHVREDGHHEHVRPEPKHIILEVLAEVEWAHHHWQHVDRQHDDTSQAKRAEVGLVAHVLPRARCLRVSRILDTLRDRWK